MVVISRLFLIPPSVSVAARTDVIIEVSITQSEGLPFSQVTSHSLSTTDDITTDTRTNSIALYCTFGLNMVYLDPVIALKLEQNFKTTKTKA